MKKIIEFLLKLIGVYSNPPLPEHLRDNEFHFFKPNRIEKGMMLVLVICTIGLVGCSSGNTDKGNKNTPVPVQEEKQTEEKLTVYDYYNKVQTEKTEKEMVEADVFVNKSNTVEDLISLINKGLNGTGKLVDKKYQLIEYCDDTVYEEEDKESSLWFIDISDSDKTINDYLSDIVGSKAFRFDDNTSPYLDENRYLGKLLCENGDYLIGYEYTGKDNEYVIFAVWEYNRDRSWFFRDCTIEDRITYWDAIVKEEMAFVENGCSCGCGNDDLSDCVNTCTEEDCDHPENVSE